MFDMESCIYPSSIFLLMSKYFNDVILWNVVGRYPDRVFKLKFKYCNLSIDVTFDGNDPDIWFSAKLLFYFIL